MAGTVRGAIDSFNVEQLEMDEAPISFTQPSPVFPTLENRPLPLTKDFEKEHFLGIPNTSSLFSLKKANEKSVQQNPNENNSQFGKKRPVRETMFMHYKKWLTKIESTTGKSNTNLNAKKRKIEDPDKNLAKLEQKETNACDGEDGKEEKDNQDKLDVEKEQLY